ncbi:MAG: hypothetical protein COA50_06190 [Flavobacteriaceae bacterium]|nr:MAG: hypothetical protein COA50_06190 [Flavobacteriaceae bacterium]
MKNLKDYGVQSMTPKQMQHTSGGILAFLIILAIDVTLLGFMGGYMKTKRLNSCELQETRGGIFPLPFKG